MSGTQPNRDDKMFFGAQTPFRPQWALNILKKSNRNADPGHCKAAFIFCVLQQIILC
jgi:hypothetical protein